MGVDIHGGADVAMAQPFLDQLQMLDALAWSIQYVNENAINRTSRVGTL